MARLVNELRAGLGLDRLTYSSDLADGARGWSQTMRDDDIFYHNPKPPGAEENIAWVLSRGSLLDKVQTSFDSLVDSPGHYANMIDAHFKQIGVGIAVAGLKFWVTQNFGFGY